MPLLGQAAIAMWWDIAADVRCEFEDWHAHEHFPERLGIPGFLRGARYVAANGAEGVFVMYELDVYETLSSPHYLARLNSPTPWSIKMMPHHRNMVRSLTRVVESFGGGIGGHVMTLRLSPPPGAADQLHRRLRDLARGMSVRAGFTGAHLLRTDAPAIAETTEQKIRGRDAAADWIVVVSGYDLRALEDLASGDLSASSLRVGEVRVGVYRLALAATPADYMREAR